jgi:hypothetical protein
MKTIKFPVLRILLFLLSVTQTYGQAFNSGSTGADGPLNLTSNTTLNLPPNGIYNFTTITIPAAYTLTFNSNSLNTPVHLLATGDVNISGIIDVSGYASLNILPGAGGPGGFEGGFGGYGVGDTTRAGDGNGPGGAKFASANFTASGAYGTPGYNNGATYGNALIYPLIGGSGGTGSPGGPGAGGGGGGGAILVASNTRIKLDGTIQANGGSGGGGASGGSGGAIRLVSPIVTGTGSLRTRGGYGYAQGGAGRIRIDCLDAYAFRTLQIYDSASTRGSQMFVFKPVIPRLDIIELMGQAIPEGTQNPVQIVLPPGVATNATLTVQARNFSADVPISVVVTPENVASTNYSTNIVFTANPSQLKLSVAIPAGQVSRINVWTH